jgi:hypothetical protein
VNDGKDVIGPYGKVIRNPELAARARAELRQHTGGQPYRPPVPDAALDAQLTAGARR